MNKLDDFEKFRLSEPLGKSNCIVFSSPHSGDKYLDWFLDKTSLDMLSIRSSEDAFVGEIFQSAPFFGSFLLESLIPRTILDLNRSRNDLDSKIIEGYNSQSINSRVASGLGVIPRLVGNGKDIYQKKLTLEDVKYRIEEFYDPYHKKLDLLLKKLKALFGRAVLLDCHSMPTEAIKYNRRSNDNFPDIILGDRFGMACDVKIIDFLEAAFVEEGFKVCRNIPFSGGYITQFYGQPSKNIHAVQVEISRALYMDEKSIRKNPDFDKFCESMKNVIFKITEIDKCLPEFAIAAE